MKLNEVRSVNIDNIKGLGAVPYNQEVDYMGLRVKMKPSTFLELASDFTPNKEDLKYIKDNIKSGEPIASPFLDIDIKDDPPYKVVGHEGRHRMVAIQDVFGDYPVEVHLFFRGGVRNRDLTKEIIQDMNKGMIKQQSKTFIKGPLFESNVTLNESVLIYEGFLDSVKQYLGNRYNQSAADLSGTITDMKSAGVLIKDVIGDPDYLKKVNTQLHKSAKNYIKQLLKLLSRNRLLNKLWNRINLTVNHLIKMADWKGFLGRLGTLGFLRYLVTNASNLTESIVDVILDKVMDLKRIIANATLGGFLQIFEGLNLIKKYFFDSLTTIKNKLEFGRNEYSNKMNESANINNTEAGEWLKNYTYDGISKYPNESIVDYLMQNYSNKKPLTIYRGLHFDNKEQYDEFMSNLKENNYQIRTKNISSWTPSFETAEDFALTKKSYYPTASIMSQEQERSDSKEYITGYRGVVLEANIGPHSGIMVSDTPYAKEDEVILPKGTYKVKINATTKRFSDVLGDGEETVVSLIDKMLDPKYKDDDYHKKFFDFITHNYSKDIQQSEELKNKVYQIFVNRVKKSNKDFVRVDIQEDIFGKYNEVKIFFNYSLFDLADKGFLPSKQSGALQKYADKIVQEYYNTVKKYNGPDYVYDLGLLNRIVKKYASPKMNKMADEIFQIQVGNAYQMLNDKSNIDKINSIVDPKEKRKVMNDFTEKMKMILGQVK